MSRELTMKKVIKRNNEIVPFDAGKITTAIEKAFAAVNGKCDHAEALKLGDLVLEELQQKHHGRTIPAVEEIQDMVEKVLMDAGHTAVAKDYILYRDQHKKIRDTKELLLDIQKTMDGYLHQSDWRVNENSNINYSLGGLILHNSGAITANYWLSNIYTKAVAEAHTTGDFHIHDLGMFSGYCAGWSLRQLLLEGLGGVPGKINSKPAKHLSTAIIQMVNFLGTMQNEWAGAQAFSSFDTYLAPFVMADKLTYKEVKQCVQSFVFSMNTPSRWGSQSPFTNITLDWIPPIDLKNQRVIIDGREGDFTYGECQAGMDMINKAYIEVMMEGDADGRGFSYPIPTYNITKDFDWNSENANLLFQITAKYGTPYFQNFINSDLDPSDVRSMCCRLQLDKRELKKRGGGLFGADEFTGSIGVVTINLPRIGYLAKNKDDFFRRLDDLMDIAKTSLEMKRRVVVGLMAQGLFPYTKRYLKHFNNHFSTIGLNGMHECCLNFLKQSITSVEGKNFSMEVLVHMRERLIGYQEETGNLYNLEATPAEGTSYRLAMMDKKRCPGIIQSGKEEPYYTNSTHLPVDYTDDIFSALDFQDELQTKYTGGTVFHGFLGEAISDTETCKNLVRKVAQNYRLPYFTLSPTFSVCDKHGRISGEYFKCPTCGGETEVYSRIVGYYRPVQHWNAGKKAEFHDRKTYTRESFDSLPAQTQSVASLKVEAASAESVLGIPTRYKFFYSDTCAKCPPVKNFVAALPLKGSFINVTFEEGVNSAKQYNVRSLPSVVLLDDKENVVAMVNSIEGIKECLLADSNASV